MATAVHLTTPKKSNPELGAVVNVIVEAFENNHGEFKNSFGFVFTTNDKKIVISGDTAYSQKVIEKSKGADILVHEVYSERGFREKTKDWQTYHKAHHTSAPDVGKLQV